MPTFECPTCRAQVVYGEPSEVPFRPFCSKRCQFIDLGKWFNEEYRVSEELPPDEEPEERGGQPGPRVSPEE